MSARRGRRRLGAHWPTDVAAGAVPGLFWLAVLLRASRARDY